MDSIILAKNVDLTQVTYGAPRVLDSGSRAVYLNHKGKPLYLQTPEMSIPFGLSKWSNDGKGQDKYSIDLSFKGKDTNSSLKSFFEKISDLDAKLINDCMDNSSSWMKKKIDQKPVIEALYTPMVKFPKDKNTGDITDKYPPTFKISIPMKDGFIDCDVYDGNRELIKISDIEKNSKVTAIIKGVGLWIAGGKFGFSWKLVQLRVVPPPTIKGFSFQDDDEVHIPDSGSEGDAEKFDDQSNIDNKVIIESSDDELDIPAQARIVKKK